MQISQREMLTNAEGIDLRSIFRNILWKNYYIINCVNNFLYFL